MKPVGKSLDIEPGFSKDYKRAKSILNKGKHPTFIGKDMVKRHSRNGGLFFYTHQGRDVGVSLINPRLSVLLVLNVLPDYRGLGYGQYIVNFLMPNFVRAIEDKVGFFEALGYIKIGSPKQGRRYLTQVMVREKLLHLAGRMRGIFNIDGD